MPRRQRTVGDQAHVHLPANGDQFPLVLAVQQVVVVFHSLKSREAVVARRELHIIELVSEHRGSAERTDLSRLHEPVQNFHRLLHRSVIIKAVDDIEVKIVGSEPFQRAVDLSRYRVP